MTTKSNLPRCPRCDADGRSKDGQPDGAVVFDPISNRVYRQCYSCGASRRLSVRVGLRYYHPDGRAVVPARRAQEVDGE